MLLGQAPKCMTGVSSNCGVVQVAVLVLSARCFMLAPQCLNSILDRVEKSGRRKDTQSFAPMSCMWSSQQDDHAICTAL